MNWFKRFIWWKCIFWFALGAAIGGAVSITFPESGPGSARRISAEQFVALFQYPVLTDGSRVSAITMYPDHDSVDLVTFDLSGARNGAYYIYGQRPFIRIEGLKAMERGIARTATDSLLQRARNAVLGQSSPLADLREKEAQAHMAPFREWASVADFLSEVKTTHPELQIRRAWWTDQKIQRGISTAAGALVIGTLCSLLLSRRSREEQSAHEIMSAVDNVPAISAPPAGPTAEDIRKIQELDEALSHNLSMGNAPVESVPETQAAVGAVSTPSVARLANEPLAAPIAVAQEEKNYAGTFYPTARVKPRVEPTGFSLVELIVVIGILAILMGILLPVLVRARRSADAIACAANLHSIAQGFAMYLQSNRNTFPASYTYINQAFTGPTVSMTGPSSGYIHWSSYLYGQGAVPQAAFTCPSMDRGGLPPTNTTPDNMNAGQTCPNPAIVDEQAPRLAYTANEALCPRNKFNTGFQSAVRTYRFVKANEVDDTSNTILVTEMVDNGNMISYGDSSAGYIMSHRPIQGFCNAASPDIFLLPIGAGFRPCTRADIDPDPLTSSTSNTRLDLVGRNHGPKQGYPDRRLSNFAYVDGHVETKSVYDTVEPFQWGAKFYSLVPNDDFHP